MKKQDFKSLWIAGLLLIPSLVMAESNPCKEDVQTFCEGVEQGKMNIINCLKEHWDQISEECKEAQEWHQELNEELLTNCEEDRKEHCQEVEPAVGADPLAECLEAYLPELSPSCREALLNHQAAQIK